MATHVAALLGASILTAGAASAATVSFVGGPVAVATSLSGSTGIDGIGYTVTPEVDGVLNLFGLISDTAAGLGVIGAPDQEPAEIDGSIFSTEALTVTFDSAVNLDSFTLGLFDFNDDYTLLLDGVLVGSALTAGVNAIDTIVTSFTVLADGDLFSDFSEGILGNDDFTLASFTVSPIPLPAGAGLLLAALGGLGLVARRRAAA